MNNVTIDRLNWDSDFFKLEVGKLTIQNDWDLSDVITVFSKSSYDLVYAFTDPENITLAKQFQNDSIPIADQKVLFSKIIVQAQRIDNNIKQVKKIVPGLIEIATQSGEYSRFKRDPKINSFFKDIYKQWIHNSLTGNFDDAVYVYFNAQMEVEGLITLKNNSSSGKIGLIAVNTQARGLGIGRKLIAFAENWCFEHKLEKLDVITQKENQLAFDFYHKCGFTLAHSENIYHLWK